MDPINKQVAHQLRKLRRDAGLSLEELARRSGVSRAMLSQIETLKTNPTIAVLWKVAGGLAVSFADLLGEDQGGQASKVRLLRHAEARYLTSADGGFRSRPLLANVPGHNVEVYELGLEPRAVEESEPHPPGTFEQLVALSGKVRLAIGADSWDLGPRDALLFPADVEHRYQALGAKPFMGVSIILYGS